MRECKVTINEYRSLLNEPKLIDIPIGTYFIGSIANHSGLFLRTFDEIVLINKPNNTWQIGSSGNVTVTNFMVVDVTINYDVL